MLLYLDDIGFSFAGHAAGDAFSGVFVLDLFVCR